METESHPIIQSQLAAKRDRALFASDRIFREMIAGMKQVYQISPETNAIEPVLAFNFDSPIFHEFAERLMRAILWEEFRKPFFEGDFEWRLNHPHPPDLLAALEQHGQAREVHEIFQYVVRDDAVSGQSLLFAKFYRGISLTIKSEPLR